MPKKKNVHNRIVQSPISEIIKCRSLPINHWYLVQKFNVNRSTFLFPFFPISFRLSTLDFRILTFVFIICFSVFPQSSAKHALAIATTPCFEKPAPGLLPIGFVNKFDTCQTDSSLVDTLGVPWFRVRLHDQTSWVHAGDMRFVVDASRDFVSIQAKGDDDKKRRLQILQSNPDWPHRIKMSVRAGQICLDMSEDQLAAAWGDPFQKGTTYTLGIGDHATWLYKSSSGKILLVNLQNGRVIGWTVDK